MVAVHPLRSTPEAAESGGPESDEGEKTEEAEGAAAADSGDDGEAEQGRLEL